MDAIISFLTGNPWVALILIGIIIGLVMKK